jgi:ribosomal protein S18 acetylase RimI-like enzyme
MDIEIRRLQHGDEEIALQVVRDLMPEGERDGREPGLLHLQRFLDLATNYLIVGLASGKPIAFLTAYQMPALSCDASMVYLFEIEVAQAYRRQGIGKQMIQLLKQLCKNSGVEDIWVGTENDNEAARRLYQSTGGICSYPDNCEFFYNLTQDSANESELGERPIS